MNKVHQIIGALAASSAIVRHLHSETMRGWIEFQQRQLYKKIGYKSFNDFLSQSSNSPMPRAAFYERKALLEREGDQVFDLFNSLGIPFRRRKLLGAEKIELKDDRIVIEEQPDQKIEIELDNKARLVETITAVIDRDAASKKRLNRARQTIDRSEQKIEQLNKKVERIKRKEFIELDAHASALVAAVVSLKKLLKEVEKLPPEEKDRVSTEAAGEISLLLETVLKAYMTTKSVSLNLDEQEKELLKTLENGDNNESIQ